MKICPALPSNMLRHVEATAGRRPSNAPTAESVELSRVTFFGEDQPNFLACKCPRSNRIDYKRMYP